MSNVYLHIRWLGKKFVIYEDIPVKRYFVIIVGEFTGTFILNFLGCLADAMMLTHFDIAISFGLAVMTSVQVFAHLSGSHINPPVSIAAFLLGYISLSNLPIYIIFQLLGGIAGHAMVLVITSPEIRSAYKDKKNVGVCTPLKHPTLEDWQVCLCEFVLTFLLIIVCAAVWDWRNKERFDSVSIRFGLVIGVLAIAGGAVSGSNMNPARTFGPCLLNNDFLSYHWAYWVGPVLAGLIGPFYYRLIFAAPEPGVDDVEEPE